MSDIDVGSLGSEGSEEVVPTFVEPGASPIAGIQGEYKSASVRYPTFSIIHGVGPNFAKFPQNTGEFIYANERLVGKPVEFALYGLVEHYRQNLAYDPEGPRSIIFKTAKEVLESGGNLKEFVPDGADDNNYRAEAVAYLGIFAPKGKRSWAAEIESAFPCGDELLVPAAWNLAKSAYRSVVPKLRMIGKRLQMEKKLLSQERLSVTTVHQKIGANFVFIPVVKKSERASPNDLSPLLVEAFGD